MEFLQGVRLVGSLALQSISLTKVKDRFAPLSDHVAIKVGGPVPWICHTAKSPCRSPTDEGVVVTFPSAKCLTLPVTPRKSAVRPVSKSHERPHGVGSWLSLFLAVRRNFCKSHASANFQH